MITADEASVNIARDRVACGEVNTADGNYPVMILRCITYLNLFRVVHILQSELILIVKSELVDLVLQLYHQGVFVLKVAPCHQYLLFIFASHATGREPSLVWEAGADCKYIFSRLDGSRLRGAWHRRLWLVARRLAWHITRAASASKRWSGNFTVASVSRAAGILRFQARVPSLLPQSHAVRIL